MPQVKAKEKTALPIISKIFVSRNDGNETARWKGDSAKNVEQTVICSEIPFVLRTTE